MGPSGDRYVTLPVGHQKLRIRYVTAGGAGHPVLLLHGFGGSADHWRLVMPALARHFRVYAIDLPGFGRSERPGRGFHISDLSQAAGAFIKAFGLSSLRVAGHSMGGQIAVEVARMHQTRVDRLVVIDSSGLNPRPLSTAIRMMLRFPTLGWMWSRVVATEPVFRRRLRFLAADESRLTEADRKTLRQGILQVRLPASRGEAWAFERFLDR
ncbi:MAG TPA: alpha/beta fold hydrolase, partial [Bacillota bacterium]